MRAQGLLYFLLAALLLAATLAFADEPAPHPPLVAAAAPAEPEAVAIHGVSPMPGNVKVPAAFAPPGSFEPDTGPSDVIYPPQKITIRFNHKFHLKEAGATCKTCHAGAYTSASVNDRLTPAGTACDACHLTDHEDLRKVEAGDGEAGQCAFCHLGHKASDGNLVARMILPRANMVFNHQKHLTRNIQCGQCHGRVDEIELATRDQLPRMRGCFKCHQMADAAARGDAKSECTVCHVSASAPDPGIRPSTSYVRAENAPGRMKTVFASGVLEPPRWMHNAAHTPDFIERHKFVAGNESQFCSNCHKEDFCVGCHDGRVRPKSIHPSDYLSMHPIEARQATQRCTSCHQEQSFCLGCHQRVGVTMSGPTGARESGRFHPPKAIWSDAPRKPGHHSFDAQRNLNACVSCHIERDCVVCHGGSGIGGGFNPHKSGFMGGCATQMRRNPRPCFVCHMPDDAVLSQC